MIGSKLTHYQITAHLGSGGFGDVYQARDSKLGRSVAIKLLPEVSTYTVQRDSFYADKPALWSEGQFTDRGALRNFDLHPDGQRFAVLKAPEGPSETRLDKVVLIQNFFDELRRIAPPEQ